MSAATRNLECTHVWVCAWVLLWVLGLGGIGIGCGCGGEGGLVADGALVVGMHERWLGGWVVFAFERLRADRYPI